ncbi:aspartate aminotransferase family protein [Agrobacterium rhizogenes]|nr:aspartate aminotransferase family protein [Rhizobium rhizogenes]NTH75468.1 aspartate aminotransferase family protein [Rhizobium rhizogenes]
MDTQLNTDSRLLRSALVCPDWTKAYPKIVSGSGSLLLDEHGTTYIDGSGGASAATLLGHGNSEVASAMYDQACLTPLLPTHYFDSDIVEEYLAELVDFAPPNIGYAWLASSGSDAIENAMKLAVQYHRLRGQIDRIRFIGREQSYHGGTFAALDIGGVASRRRNYEALFFGHYHVPAAHCLRCPFGLEPQSCSLECAEEVLRVIKNSNGSIAAVIVEPIVGAALGAVSAPENYLQRLRTITRETGVLLIFDEIMTGFGRTGANFVATHHGVEADIIVCGKGMSGGYYPLSGMLVARHIGFEFESRNEPFQSGHTHACSPQGAAVGRKVLEVIKRDGLVERAGRLGCKAIAKLRENLSAKIVADIRGKGLLFGLEFQLGLTRHQSRNYPAFSYLFGERALASGLISYPGMSASNSSGGHVKFAPPLNIEERVFDKLLDIVIDVVKELESKE